MKFNFTYGNLPYEPLMHFAAIAVFEDMTKCLKLALEALGHRVVFNKTFVDDKAINIIMDRFQADIPNSAKVAERQKFVRVLATYGGARVTVPLRIRADKGEAPTAFGSIIATHERIKKYTNRESGTLPDDAQMIAFGTVARM